MSNRSYEKVVELATKFEYGHFQFPVGMSNRSYELTRKAYREAGYNLFQFPVGMSNRSYNPLYQRLFRRPI